MDVPGWLLWLLPVPLATAGAIAWAAWSTRSRGPQDTADSLEEHARFRRAMQTPTRTPPPQPPKQEPERD